MIGLAGNLIDAAVLIFGKAGKILNARGMRVCFLMEMLCLCYWLYVDIERGLYAQAANCFVSFSIAVYGFKRWGKMNMEVKK
jgi:hypothetical protein